MRRVRSKPGWVELRTDNTIGSGFGMAMGAARPVGARRGALSAALWLGGRRRAVALARSSAVVVTLVFLVGANVADAHQPWFNAEGSPDRGKPFLLPTPLETSQVVFGALPTERRVDYYGFAAPAGFAWSAYLVVPDTAACDPFRPTLTLFGPGLHEDGVVQGGATTSDRAGGRGTLTDAAVEWGTFAEPAFDLYVRTGPRLERRLDGGDYLVAVSVPTAAAGTYGLTLDGDEIVGGDFLSLTALIPSWNRCESALGPRADDGVPLVG